MKIYLKTIAVFLILTFSASFVLADEVLIKINQSDSQKLLTLDQNSYSVRFVGTSFLLIQLDENNIKELSIPFILLDKPSPDDIYYLVRFKGADSFSQINELYNVIFRFGESLLIRIKAKDEPRLINMGLQIAPLPNKVSFYEQKAVLPAPRFKTPEKAAYDYSVINEIINAVSTNEIKKTVNELQENHDLNPPHTPYRSRYCLRVRQTDDPSDEACDNAADYIFNRFKSYGLDVEYDQFPHEVLTQGHYQMRNVVATLPGKGLNSQKVFIIGSHYDSVASKSTNWLLNWKKLPAPGANDNASGTAAVLEAARILSQYDFDYTIKFITFSGEELGLHGSKHYAKTAFENKAGILGVINLDMIAYDPDIPDIDIVSNAGSEWLIGAMMSIQRTYKIESLLLRKFVNPEIWYSDHFSFWSNGYNAIAVLENAKFDAPEFYPFIHSEKDTIDKLDFDLATSMIKIAVGTLASLADPVGSTPHPDLSVNEKDIKLVYDNSNGKRNVHLDATIINTGKVDAKNVVVEIWVKGPYDTEPKYVSDEVVDVIANKNNRVSASYKPEEWGNYQFIVKVNPDYGIFETNGSNNMASKMVQVGSNSLEFGKDEPMIYPNPFDSSSGKVNIEYSLSKDATTRIEIYDISGRLIHQEYFSKYEPGGKFGPNKDIQWNGMNLSGEAVSSGVYFCFVIAEDDEGFIKNVSRKIAVIK